MSDWDWWQDKLAGRPVEMNPGTPHAGFYRWPRRPAYGAPRTFLPVAYWPGENGQLNCRIGDQDVLPEKGEEIWERVGDNPVTEEAYRKVAEGGGAWPDEHQLVPMAGDNLPPADDTYEGLRDAIEPLASEALKRVDGPPITDQEEADRLANLVDRLAELHKKADELRKAERREHDDALKGIQKKWSPLLAAAEAYRNVKYKLITPWLDKLTQAKKQEAEAAAAAGEPAAVDARRPRAGTRGRAITLKSTKRAEITDYDECRNFFREADEMKQLVQSLADRAVRSGAVVPGTKVIEESQAV
jgi:hypothetical protein